MRLTGETTGRPEGERVPINIADTVRTDLRNLLFDPSMRGVGYSEFIWRAIQMARAELAGVGNPKSEAAVRFADAAIKYEEAKNTRDDREIEEAGDAYEKALTAYEATA